MHKKISLYLAKDFLIRFTQIIAIFSLLIFFINLLESLDKTRASGAPFIVAVEMAFLQIASFLNDVVSSLVLISAIITFATLSIRSEITIIRMSGLSLWRVVLPIAVSAFILGISWITIFGPISIKMAQSFDNLERLHINKEIREVVILKNGIWLRQENKEKPEEEIIIQALKVYQGDIELKDVKILFFDKNGVFYKKIDSKKAELKNNFWSLEDCVLNDFDNINESIKDLKLATDLEADFISQKIVTDFQNVRLFSIFTLPKIIADLEASGFSSAKFKVYFYELLSKPFLFVAMIFIACFFGLGHIRNQKHSIRIFLGIIFGLVIYISSKILESLGSSEIIPHFTATWLVIILCLALGTLMIYNKEHN